MAAGPNSGPAAQSGIAAATVYSSGDYFSA